MMSGGIIFGLQISRRSVLLVVVVRCRHRACVSMCACVRACAYISRALLFCGSKNERFSSLTFDTKKEYTHRRKERERERERRRKRVE